MGDPRDGFELLQAANPVDVDQVEGLDSEVAQALLATITTQPRPDLSSGRRWRRPLRLAAALAAMVAVLVAATWLLTRDVENPQAIACHQAVDLDSDIAAAPVGGPATAEACVPVWEDGILENSDATSAGSVPPLTACVTDRGNLAVFPTDDRQVCETLGLAYPEPTSRDAADQIRQLDADLQAYFASKECAGMDEAEDRVRETLDDSGFGGWNIETQEATDTRPCASYSLDAEAETIHLIPIPEPDS
ncbi:MAG: hypothetical protein ACLFWH_13630 [Actinomycetota bacterium]